MTRKIAMKKELTQEQAQQLRPTIPLDRVIASTPESHSFSGWGPRA
jgi:hypothetical protein